MPIRIAGLILLAVACNKPPPDAAKEPFPEDTDDEPVLPTTSSTTFPSDTGFAPPEDEAPGQWLHVRHEGVWNLSGTPYSSVGGTLTLTEIVDASPSAPVPTPDDSGVVDTADLPDCQVEIAMTGTTPEDPVGCPCDFTFDIEMYVSDGDLGRCRAPDLPTDGAVWRMGYSSADGRIYLNYQGSGVYVPWYPAEKVGDAVRFEWTVDLGILVEEEEE